MMPIYGTVVVTVALVSSAVALSLRHKAVLKVLEVVVLLIV